MPFLDGFVFLKHFFYYISLVNKDPSISEMLIWSDCTYIKLLSLCQNVFTKISTESAGSLCLISDSSRRVYPLRQEFLRKGVLLGATRSAVREENREQGAGSSQALRRFLLKSGISLTPGELWELSHLEVKSPSFVALYQSVSGCRGPPGGREQSIISQTFPGNMTFSKR